MKLKTNGIDAAFSQLKSNILRCVFTKGGAPDFVSYMIQDEALKKQHEPEAFTIRRNGDGLLICCESGNPLLEIAKCSLKPVDVIRYTTGGEKPLIKTVKTVDGQRTEIQNLLPHKEREAFQGVLELNLKQNEAIYGFGQDEEGGYNRRGGKLYLYQHNMRIPMPCMYSGRGYGILFDCASLMVFDDTGSATKILFDTVSRLDFYLVKGGVSDFVAAYRFLTGKASLLPKWAFGYVQSRETYKTGDELVSIARRHRDLGIPIDCVVQDWKTWKGDDWGQKTVDKERYPDLKDTIEQLHRLNVHTMVSVWPNMAVSCANHREFADADLLLGDYSTYDAFSEDAREMYWKQAEKELFSKGFDAWWCDSTEPFTAPDWCGEKLLPEEERYALVGNEHKKYLDPAFANFYAVMHAKGMYENQRKAAPGKRMLNLTRSGYAGIQQYGAVLWAGDTSASWRSLKAEIAKGLSMSISGIPYWTVDIGAFFTGGTVCWRKWKQDENASPVWFWNGDYDDGVNNPGYRELYIRWLQFGCFLPMFRSHGTDTPREIWNFGKEGGFFYDIIANTIRLRYSLLPYIYSVAADAAEGDGTMINSLLADYPNDAIAAVLDDEFLFGHSLLVCPVTEPMYYDKTGAGIQKPTVKTCYLPTGADWYDFWSGIKYEGGQSVTVDAGLNHIPLFVKAGSIIPMQNEAGHALQTPGEINIRIYPGADGEFTLYDDDGLTYDYEKGIFETILFSWNDRQNKLTISKTTKLRNRAIRFKIQCGELDKEIIFDGGDIEILVKRRSYSS